MALSTSTGRVAARATYEEVIEWALTNGEAYYQPLVKGDRRGMFSPASATFQVPEANTANLVLNDYAYATNRPLGNHQFVDTSLEEFSPLVNKAGSLIFPRQQQTFLPAGFTPEKAVGEYLREHWVPFINKHTFSYVHTACVAGGYVLRQAQNGKVDNLDQTGYAAGDMRKVINAVKKKLSKQSRSNYGIARNGIVGFCTYDVWENVANDSQLATEHNKSGYDDVIVKGEWMPIAGVPLIPVEEGYLPMGVKCIFGYRNMLYNPFYIDMLDFSKKPEYDDGTLGQVHLLTDVFILAQALRAFCTVY